MKKKLQASLEEPQPKDEIRKGITKKWAARYRGRIVKNERPRDGLWVVLADHSTDGQRSDAGWEGGEPSPKGSTAGKVKPGVTIDWKELRERLRAHQPYHRNSSRVCNFPCSMQGKNGKHSYAPNGVSPVGLAIGIELSEFRKLAYMVTEEPDEGNLHVRVCGGSAG